MNLPNGWKKVKLGDVCSLLSGQDFAPELYSDETLGTPYITGASNFANNHIVLNRWTNCPRCIAHRGEILLVCKGSGFGTLAIADFESAHIARQIMALQNLKGVDRDFLFNVIATNFLNIKQKGCGLIPGIDRKTVLNISFALPPLAEQKKIAETLSVWDSAIEKMEKLVVLQNKRFQQMLKEHIVEKIDDGAWDTCRVGDLFDAVTRKNKENCKNVLTSSAQLGLVNQQEYYKKSVSALDVTGYYFADSHRQVNPI
ncbi:MULTISPECIES: restriction endonuclease subunit S [unclassified Fibrobacter]|uniref:restriction endonuclease subunit S n=1 Tax=unclassified Fibrobacter TaxID=2634177 RepID=UPI000D6B72D5|nr:MULTISPECIES: restriction endonuclease subunit S [unclassified Fibrobacter]PWJ60711.1 type I restriction modification DNA specificity protein [Fibrobacter sp. UWR4]PZW63915.1 type I restriction modification DNA specificity protein [Fibrobacter sp. UWR1]